MIRLGRKTITDKGLGDLHVNSAQENIEFKYLGNQLTSNKLTP